MTKLEKFNERLQQMQLDLRLEVILADLVTESLGMEEISVISNSLFKRNYHHDIEKTLETEYGQGKKKKLCFIVNREGIYDRLPEDLFHQPSDNYSSVNNEKIIQEIKIQNELETAARNFFLPFEHEFYRQRVKLETEERKFLFETNDDLPGEVFDDLWGLPVFLDRLQISRLGLLMPLVHKFGGNLEMVAFLMSVITGDDVEIKESFPQMHALAFQPVLGECLLGYSSTMGGEVHALQSSLDIKIFVPHIENITDYMPGGKKIKIHEFLCNLFISFEKDINFELDFSKTSSSFIIENETSYLGRLNYTTVI